MRRAVPILLCSIVVLWSFSMPRFAAAAPPGADTEASGGVFGPIPIASPDAVQLASPQVDVRAATATGQIAGTVLDQAGAVIPNAIVTVTDKKTSAKWTSKTDSQGRFSVAGLPFGSYSVTVELAGFQKKIIDGVTVGVDRATTVNAVLSVGAERTTVGAAAPAPRPRPVQRSPAEAPVVPKDSVAAENKAFEDWHNSLPQGLSEQHADPVMRLGKESAVTFTIHGPNAPGFTPAAGTTPGKLQVSPMMAVYLTQPDNPDGFKIVDSDSPENPKRVAPDGTTTWTWIVTPLRLGPLKLHMAAYVLRGDSESDEASYKSYDDPIDVKSVTFWGYLTTGFVWVLNNPGASLKWILPGGAGAALIGKLIHWLVTRKKKAAVESGDAGGS